MDKWGSKQAISRRDHTGLMDKGLIRCSTSLEIGEIYEKQRYLGNR